MIGPVVVVTASLQTLLMAGRVEVCEIGILKTFARDARTGERGLMVGYVLNWDLERGEFELDGEFDMVVLRLSESASVSDALFLVWYRVVVL